MKAVKQRLDVRLRILFDGVLSAWGHRVYKSRWLIILFSLAFFMGLASQVGKVPVDVSTEAFLHPNDPIRVAYGAFREKFGREEVILVAVKTPDIFTIDSLERIRALHQDLENNVPHLESVTSLINARDTFGRGDELIVGELIKEWPQSSAQLGNIKQRALANSLYKNAILSIDGTVSALIIKISTYSDNNAFAQESDGVEFNEALIAPDSGANEFITGEETAELADAVEKIIANHQAENFEIFHAGAPVSTHRLTASMQQDMPRFLGSSLLVIALLVFVIFKRVSAVVLSLFVILLSVASTLGSMAITGASMGVSTQIMPSFLLAVGVSACIHLLTIFYRHFDDGHSVEDALAYALGHSGLAIIMTSLTTAGAMVSFAFVDVAPIATMGIYTPVGIILGLTISLTLLPALLAVTPIKRKRSAKQDRRPSGLFENRLVQIGEFSVSKPWTVLSILGILVVISGLGMSQLTFKYNPVEWYPENDVLRTDLAQIDKDMGGSHSLEVYIDTHKPGGVVEPEFLQRLLKAQKTAEQFSGDENVRVTTSLSIVDIIREINQGLNGNDPTHFTIPNDRDLIVQELFLFENGAADDLFEFVDSDFQTTRVSFKVAAVSPSAYQSLIDQLQPHMEHELGEQVSVRMTGFVPMMARSEAILSGSLMTSYIIALLLITPLMIAVVGEVKAGLTSMIPNLTPIIFTLGLMGWIGIPLNPFTLMIASIAIGLAVDDTIHFMQVCRKLYDETGDIHRAVEETLRSTGRALLFTSIILSTAFFTYLFSSLNNLFDFGLLTGFSIIMALLADLTIAPALMKLHNNKKNVVKS